MEIKKTTDYGQFKTKKGNRVIAQGTVNRLKKSIKNKNMLAANPIIVNKNMEVIDGQHRLAAAKQLVVPIFYVEFDPASLAEIQLLNANVKSWTSKDFLKSYIEIGRDDYRVFRDFWMKYEFPFSTVMVLLVNPEGLTRTHAAHQKFREGKFQVADLAQSVIMAEKINEIMPFTFAGVKSSNRFYDAVFLILKKNPEHFERLIQKMIGRKRLIFRMETRNDYIRQFEDIMNEGNYGKPIRLI